MKSVVQVPWIIWSLCSPWSFAEIWKVLYRFLNYMIPLFSLKLCWDMKSVVQVPWIIWSLCSPWSFAEIWKVLYRFPEFYDPFVLPEALLRNEKCFTGSLNYMIRLFSLKLCWDKKKSCTVSLNCMILFVSLKLCWDIGKVTYRCMVTLFSLKLCWNMKSAVQV